MLRYIVGRLLQATVTLVAVALVTFALMHAIPGGPFGQPDPSVPESVKRAQEAYYGLDDPIPQQLARYLGNLARGDLGISFAQRGQSVNDLLADRVAVSAVVGAMAFAIVVVVGVPMGATAAIWRGRFADYAGLGFSTVLAAVPSFVLAFGLLLVFAVWLGVVDVRSGRDFELTPSGLPAGLLPALALAAPMLALLLRVMRASLIEVLSSDYLRTARAKGLGPRPVYLRHGMRNALLPVLTLLGPMLADLIGGSIVVETVFGLPGVGSAYVTSITQRDYGVIMGFTMFYAALVLAVNLAVDLAYPIVDPRIRLAS